MGFGYCIVLLTFHFQEQRLIGLAISSTEWILFEKKTYLWARLRNELFCLASSADTKPTPYRDGISQPGEN